MTDQLTVSEQLARHLLEIEAVKLNANEPFTWASGMKSPVYCDNRKILSFPRVRDFVRDGLSAMVKERYPDAEIVAGVATGAIAIGVLVAQSLDLPFVYVRASQKGHGLGNQVEGHLPEGKKVVVIEDLVSTGQSSLSAVDALYSANVQVLGMLAIFTYGLDKAQTNMESARCQLHTLTDFNTLLQQAVSTGIMHHSNLETLEKWRENPQAWTR